MNTTSVFVELVVIGVGAAVAVLLVSFACFGHSWILEIDVPPSLAAIPLLSLVYVLGIVIDRQADRLFDRLWKTRMELRAQEEHGLGNYDDRRLLLTTPGRLGDLLEYGRSRLRICRGWTVNSVLILIALHLYLWRLDLGPEQHLGIAAFATFFLLAFAWASWAAWRQLTLTEFRKVKQQAEFLRRHDTADDPHRTQRLRQEHGGSPPRR